MEFSATNGSLVAAIKAIERIVPARSPNENYLNVLVSAREGEILVEASCGTAAAYYAIEDAEADSQVGACVRGEHLIAIAKACKEEVRVKIDKDGCRIWSGTSYWSIPCLPPTAFSRFKGAGELPQGVEVPSGWLATAFDACEPVFADAAITGAVMQIGVAGAMLIVGASSATRAIFHKREVPDDATIEWVSLPDKTALQQAKAFLDQWAGDVSVHVTPSEVALLAGPNRFSFNPAWEKARYLQIASRAQPKDSDFTARVNKKELLDAIKRVTLTANQSRKIKLWSGSGFGLLFNEDGAAGKVEIEPLDMKGAGSVYLSHEYLHDAAKAIETEDINIASTLTGPLFLWGGTSRAIIALMVEEEDGPVAADGAVQE